MPSFYRVFITAWSTIKRHANNVPSFYVRCWHDSCIGTNRGRQTIVSFTSIPLQVFYLILFKFYLLTLCGGNGRESSQYIMMNQHRMEAYRFVTVAFKSNPYNSPCKSLKWGRQDYSGAGWGLWRVSDILKSWKCCGWVMG